MNRCVNCGTMLDEWGICIRTACWTAGKTPTLPFDGAEPEPPPTDAEVEAADAAYLRAKAIEDAITKGLRDREIRAEVERRWNALYRPPAPMPEPVFLPDLLAQPMEPVRYRVEGLLGVGGRVLVAAAHKAGKSTLVGNLIKCLVDGGMFLGQHHVTPVDGRVVLLDTELPQRLLQEWLSRQNIQNQDRVVVLSLRDRVTSFNLTNPDALMRWADLLLGLKPAFVVLDCLRPVLDAAGLDERAEVGRFLVPFGELLGRIEVSEAALVQHMGHVGERARGDSALLGWPDVNWKIVRKDAEDDSSTRFFSAFGRDVDVPERELGFNSMTGQLLIAGGGRKEAAARAALPDLLALLREEPGLNGSQIEMRLGVPTHVARTAVKIAVTERKVRFETIRGNTKCHYLSGS